MITIGVATVSEVVLVSLFYDVSAITKKDHCKGGAKREETVLVNLPKETEISGVN